MSFKITPGFQLVGNSSCVDANALGEKHLKTLNPAGFKAAYSEISQWPDYTPTPLEVLDNAAKAINVAGVFYKNESTRFGLGSFKALGGAYAVSNLLKRIVKESGVKGDVSDLDLRSGKYRQIIEGVTITCATDGNHGRSVAWGCQQYGCQCVIYIHETVSEGRQKAIEQYGASVVRVPGNYDDAVRQADQDAKNLGRYIVSDTSYEGYMDVPKDVMQGYTVMADEAFSQLPEGTVPTHIFVQGGVGGLAAAVVAQAWQRYRAQRPVCVVVEPEKADCLYKSAEAGYPVTVEGDLDTLMAGLACGEVSLLAWEILEAAVSHFMTVSDESAIDCMRLLAGSELCAAHEIIAGESAVAGLSGLLLASQDEGARRTLGLDENSCVLLIGSEGATDPQLYHELVTEFMAGEEVV